MSKLESNPGCLGRLLQLLSGGGGAVSGDGVGADGTWPYRRKDELLSRAEFSFFRVLQSVAVENDWVVCPKVNLGDLITPIAGTEKWQTWRNKVDRKHADFVLCDADTMEPVMVVELDDKSHGSAKAQRRDATKDRGLGAAGLPIVRVRVPSGGKKGYGLETVREQLAAGLAAG